MIGRVGLVAALLLGCERETTPAAPIPAAPCLTDELGELSPGWEERDDCGGDSVNTCVRDCETGDGNACFNGAIALQTAGGARDDATIQALFARACTLGLSLGCTNWAAGAWDITASYTERHCILRVFERACDVDDQFACGMVGRLLIEAPRTPVDPTIGHARLISACNRLEGPPCRFLAYYIELGLVEHPDPERVRRLLKRACDGGDEDTCGATTASQTMRP